ncbi:MAG: hypothetical protein J6Q69_00825, partial [Clostridia bacterium]|nr:hypothetical protein [Clostridia bacterium]
MTDNEKNKEGAYAALTGFRRAVPIVLVALAVFISVCFFTQNDTGYFGIAIAGTLTGLFSVGAYFIPVLLAIHAFFYPSDVQKKRLISRIIFSVLLLIFISSFAQAVSNWSWCKDPVFDGALMFENGKMIRGGGFIGGAIAFLIISVIGGIGFILLATTVFAIYITYFLAGEGNPARSFLRKVLFAVLSFFAKIERNIKRSSQEKREMKIERQVEKKLKEDEKKKKKGRKDAKKIAALNEKESDLYDDEFFEVDNGLKELKIGELGIEDVRSTADVEINPTLQTRVHHKSEIDREEKSDVTFRTSTVITDYGLNDDTDYTLENSGNDYVIKETNDKDSIINRFSYGLDDNAENVFGAGFVPMNFAENEILATKQSTMGPTPVTEPRNEPKKEPEKVVSDEDIAAARRRLDFEMRKAELKKQHEQAEAERSRAAAFTPTSFEFDINPDKAPKEPEPATPAYSTASYGYEAKSYPADDAPVSFITKEAPKPQEEPIKHSEPATYSYSASSAVSESVTEV